eukprot:scaffold24199_cov56-Isochrysis_galbana.AAC.1
MTHPHKKNSHTQCRAIACCGVIFSFALVGESACLTISQPHNHFPQSPASKSRPHLVQRRHLARRGVLPALVGHAWGAIGVCPALLLLLQL